MYVWQMIWIEPRARINCHLLLLHRWTHFEVWDPAEFS